MKKTNEERVFKMKASIQLWSLNRVIPEIGLKAALKLVAEHGYSGVEFAGYDGITAEDMAAELKKNGLYSVGSHTGFDLFKDALEENLLYNKTIGSEYMIIPAAPTANEREVREVIDVLNAAAEKAKDYGIKVGYHNHDHEFVKINGKYALDMIFEETSDDVVMEIDLFWVAYAGEDPYEYIKKFGKRAELLHFKQIGKNKENPRLPDGIIDFKKAADIAKYARHFIVEQEDESDQIESSKINMEFLKKIER